MSRKTLLADDSGTMRKIILRSLNALGITDVVEAADGALAIAAFQPGAFELVLTDWNMPNKSGLDVTREIRALDPQVPIIMITTEADRDHVVQAIQAGVTDYLIKPFTTDALQEKLSKHVPALV
jgi:two-component system chemotaxis response regulator CheY